MNLIRWCFWVCRICCKGLGWLVAAFLALLGATNDWEPALQKWREWGVHDFVGAAFSRVTSIEIDTALISLLVLVQASLFIWFIHTKPKRQIKETYLSELEANFPGLKEKQRGRRARRRRRGKKKR